MLLHKLLNLANYASKDRTLLKNHIPFVPDNLKKERKELEFLISALGGEVDNKELVCDFKNRILDIDRALLIYT